MSKTKIKLEETLLIVKVPTLDQTCYMDSVDQTFAAGDDYCCGGSSLDENSFNETFSQKFDESVIIAPVVFVSETAKTDVYRFVGCYLEAEIYRDPQYYYDGGFYFFVCSTKNALMVKPPSTFYLNIHIIDSFAFISTRLPELEEEINTFLNSATFEDIVIDYLNILPNNEYASETIMGKIEKELQKEGNLKKASNLVAGAKAYIKNHSDSYIGYKYLGWGLFFLGAKQESIEAFSKALQFEAKAEDVFLAKCFCLIRLGYSLNSYDPIDEALNILNEHGPYSSEEAEVEAKLLQSEAFEARGYISEAYRILLSIPENKRTQYIDNYIETIKNSHPFIAIEKQEQGFFDTYPLALQIMQEPDPERLSRNRYNDKIRGKSVPATEEETVRQKTISLLTGKYGVPKDSILVEEHLSHIDKSIDLRADIVVQIATEHSRYRFLLIVECKKQGVELQGASTLQIINYNQYFCAPFIMLTNGDISLVYYFDREKAEYHALRALPTYEEMVREEGMTIASLPQVAWERPSFQKIQDATFGRTQTGIVIGEGVSDTKVPAILNLAFSLLDESAKVQCPVSVPGCIIEKDHGVVAINAKNPSGSGFFGNYRWLVVTDRNNKKQNMYLAVMASAKTVNDPKYGNSPGDSHLIIVVDEKGKTVPRLSLSLNKYLVLEKSSVQLFHDGRRSARKTEPLLGFIEKMIPELLDDDKKVRFGVINATKNIVLSDTETAETFGRILSYALLRSELKSIEAKKKRQSIKKKIISVDITSL